MHLPRALFALSALTVLVVQDSVQINSLSDSVVKLLEFNQKPTDLSFLICNQDVKVSLLTNLTSGRSHQPYFGGRHEPMVTLGGQEAAFIIVDLNCPSASIAKAFHGGHFNLVYSRWLMVDSNHNLGAVNEQHLSALLVDTAISQATELFYFEEASSSSQQLHIKQAYKQLKVDNSRVILEDFGALINDGSFRNIRSNNITAIRRKDLNGSHFELAITIMDPDTLNHLDDFVNPEIDPLTKNGLRRALVILEHLNGKPGFVVSRGWGQANPATNNWTGMLGDMLAGKAEFAGSPTLVRSSRLEAVDYLSYSIQTWSRIVFRAPKLSYTTNVFLLPFDRYVWLCALFLVSVIALLLLLSTWSEWNVLVPANALIPDRDMLAPQISDVIFLIFGNVCVQGSIASPRSTAGRIIIIFSLIFIVCLYVSYCAFIVALLQSPASNIRTVTDLLNSHIQVGNQDTDYFRFWMQRLTDPAEKLLYEKRILNKDGTDNFCPIDEGVKKMQKGLYAFHMETPIGYRLVSQYFNEHEKCDLREIHYGDIRSPYFVVRKHSPFKEILRILALRIKENGVQNKLWKEVYVSKPKCTQQGNFIPLALVDVSPVIFAFLGGIGLSICVFLMELLIHKYAARGSNAKLS